MMPRVFVIFRTFDRIWTCKTLTRELAPFEMDMTGGPIKFVFTVDHITPLLGSNSNNTDYKTGTYICSLSALNAAKERSSFYCLPHEKLWPCIVLQDETELCESAFVSPRQDTFRPESLARRFSVPNAALEADPPTHRTVALQGENGQNATIYFVLPTYRCTLLLDAHVASCVQCEYSRSRAFRRRFMRYLRRGDAFRNCIPGYERWTEEERESWEHYLPVPYLIDVVAVWPKQKVDYAWSDLILGNLSKHVVLEEGFAWLSTLGGAHSSLGETFLHHAERAGEISGHQLRLALQLGNESLIARCYVFWSWSLLQRGHLLQCKACILKTWRFCQSLKGRDRVLENMCKAVWSRLRYRRALNRGRLQPGVNGCTKGIFEFCDDSSDSENDCEKTEPQPLSSQGQMSARAGGLGKEERRGNGSDNSCHVEGSGNGNAALSEGRSERPSVSMRKSKACSRLKTMGPAVKVF